MGSSPRIPVVDLSPFTTGGNQAARRQVAQELAAKTRINGCVGLAGHGIPADMLEQAFDASRRFFSLSYDDKMKAPHQDGTIPRRGYSGLGKEQGGASRDLNAIGPIKEEHAEPKDFKVGCLSCKEFPWANIVDRKALTLAVRKTRSTPTNGHQKKPSQAFANLPSASTGSCTICPSRSWMHWP